MNIRDTIWDGTHIGCHNSIDSKRWGLCRVLTYLDQVPLIRVLDTEGLNCIADEMSGFFGLLKTGTIRFKRGAYTYTGYSFMTGESSYVGGNETMDENLLRWKTYYSWWNLDLHNEDAFIRQYHGREEMVVYPSSGLMNRRIMGHDYQISLVPGMTTDMIKIWLNVYNESDIEDIVNRARYVVELIINRINPELINYSNVFAGRLSKFLSHYSD